MKKVLSEYSDNNKEFITKNLMIEVKTLDYVLFIRHNIYKYQKFIEPIKDFILAYPMIQMRSLDEQKEWLDDKGDEIINVDDPDMYKGVITEFLFIKDEIFNPSLIYKIEKYNIDNCEFYKAVSYELNENSELKNRVNTFFKMDKDGKPYDIFRQLSSGEIKIYTSPLTENSFINHELMTTRDIIFNLPESSIVWNIEEDVKKLLELEKNDKNKFDIIINFIEQMIIKHYIEFDEDEYKNKNIKNIFKIIRYITMYRFNTKFENVLEFYVDV